METVWFWLATAMIAAYAVLDGFDLGAGILHLILGRTDPGRATILRAIGPFWDGNEVWLIAAGGVLFSAFPALFAASFSGFYLPLTIVVWLLMLRGLAIEFRHQIQSPVWTPLWDVVFSGASLLLTICFGAALGNIVRGVPLDSNGEFFLPLWTHFGTGDDPGVLDWYTITVSVLVTVAIAHHGALWIALKTSGDLGGRSVSTARKLWWPLVALTGIVTVLTFLVQPQVPRRLAEQPAGGVFAILAVAGLGWARAEAGRRERRAFLGSCLYLVAMLASAAFGIYPFVLPANRPGGGLTIQQAAADGYGISAALWWWIPGVLLAASYFVYLHREFAGKVDHGG